MVGHDVLAYRRGLIDVMVSERVDRRGLADVMAYRRRSSQIGSSVSVFKSINSYLHRHHSFDVDGATSCF